MRKSALRKRGIGDVEVCSYFPVKNVNSSNTMIMMKMLLTIP